MVERLGRDLCTYTHNTHPYISDMLVLPRITSLSLSIISI